MGSATERRAVWENVFNKTKIEVLKRAVELFSEDAKGVHGHKTLMCKFRFDYAESMGEYEMGLTTELPKDRLWPGTCPSTRGSRTSSSTRHV